MELHRSERFPGIAVGYVLPTPRLRPYVSAISLTHVDASAGTIFDQVYPEWPNIRLSADGDMACRPGPGALERCNPIAGIGPTSHATHFSLAPGRYWTVGLLPLGWARFTEARASDHADSWEQATDDSVFACFAPLLDIAAQGRDEDDTVTRMEAHLVSLLARPPRDEDKILRAHAALVHPAVTTVSELADQSGMTVRTLERLSTSAFGFSPKLLMRRQRFLRSRHHAASAGSVHVHHPHPQARGRSARRSHGIRNVVKLQIEEYLESARHQSPYQFRPCRGEQLLAHLEPAQCGVEPLHQRQRGRRIGVIQRHNNFCRIHRDPCVE